MLLDYFKVKEKYNMNITGVIHIGGHYGQELDIYAKDDNIKYITLFEADNDNYKVLKAKVDSMKTDKEIFAIHKGLGPFSCEMKFYKERDNQGQSNSVLKPKIHATQYPGIKFNEITKVQIDPLDRYECSNIFNFMNIDVQGFELEVLRGAKKTLKNIKWIMTEVNRDEVYENCCMVDEIDAFLSSYGLRRVETDWAGNTWGDALYVKS